MNVTEWLKVFAEDRIKIDKKGSGKSALNKAYDALQANRYKIVTRKLLDMARYKVHSHTN